MDGSVELSEIQYFYKNKSIFLTGVTSTVGKLLLERIFRLLAVKRIYVLVREKDQVAAENRCALTLDSPALAPLKRHDPEFFKKICLIEGDLEKPNLGLSENDKKTLLKEVGCIFHCGLTTRIGVNIRQSVMVNLAASRDLINLAKQMEQLTMFVVLSTVYSNFPKYEIHEKIYETTWNAEKLIQLCETASDNDVEKMRENILGEWPDEYTFTMHVLEDFVKREGKSEPICIVRPSLLLPTAEEPVTGFIDKAFGLSASSMYYAIGANRVNYFRNVTLDVIPVDYVVSLMIASGWYCGTQKLRLKRGDIANTDIGVYHCISSQEKPITTNEWFAVNHTMFQEVPTSKMIQLPMQFNTSCYYNYKLLIFVLHYCMAFLCDLGLKFTGKTPLIVDMYNKIHRSQELLSPYLLKEWYFSNDNTQKLLKRMTFKDRELFNFDILKLNWHSYMMSYAKGVRVYLLNDPMSTLSNGSAKQNRKLIIQLVSAGVLVTILYAITKLFLFRFILKL